MYRIRIVFLVVSILLLSFFNSTGQINCLPVNSDFNFTPSNSAQTNFINWKGFPKFSLPFDIVYGGPRLIDNDQIPLKYGFSHISSFYGADSLNLLPKNRAIIWYGVGIAFNNPQPWGEIRSPWANDLEYYRVKWLAEMYGYSYNFMDTRGTRAPSADILMMDIERHWEGESQFTTELGILAQKNNILTPTKYSQLSDIEYINLYKKDMQALYAEPINFLKQRGLLDNIKKISSYGDSPIKYQGVNIESSNWADWQTNTNKLSYLMKNNETGKFGSPYYDQLNFISPSAYVQAEYGENPKAKGGDYLAELLFQIEVNKAWSSKNQMPFVWLRTEEFKVPGDRWVKNYQAEAMAIFPFMAGINGLWLWEDEASIKQKSFTTYEYFINGLYKLSLYKSFFEGNPVFYAEKSARDLLVSQEPVWRAVVNNGKILIVAQSPYSSENEVVKLKVSYGKWANTISLKGREVFMCSFNLIDILAHEPIKVNSKFNVIQNPIQNENLALTFYSEFNQPANLQVYDSKGTIVCETNVNLIIGENLINQQVLLTKGLGFVVLTNKEGVFKKKIASLK